MSAYIRAPNGKAKGSISEICDEDKEDFEQEQLIKAWLEREGRTECVEFKYISRKGTARNTIDKRSVRLDAQMPYADSTRTYADIIAGSDGRDWECGRNTDEDHDSSDAATDLLEQHLTEFCEVLRLDGETQKWIKKSLLESLSLQNFYQPTNDDSHSEISTISLELLPPLSSFKG